MPISALPQAPYRQDNKTFPTPLVGDVLFSEIRDCNRNDFPEYGTPHPNDKKWPHHKLVFIKPVTIERNEIFEFFYAADRENQDLYNFEINTDDRLIRTYLIPRADYSPTNFPAPDVLTPDERFPKYVFTSQFVTRAEQVFDSIFVQVQRIYSIQKTVAYKFDPAIEKNIKITREIIPLGSEEGSNEIGKTVEISPQNSFFDLKITVEVQDLGFTESEPYTVIESIPSYVNYQFPPRLNDVDVIGASAYASSTGAPPSFSEDFFFDLNITEPAPPPYSARVLRYITGNPDLIRELWPLDKVIARRDIFGYVKSWSYAGDQNKTSATARQVDTGRPTIHPDIDLPAGINYVSSGSSTPSAGGSGRTQLSATPNYSSFINSNLLTLGVDTKKIDYNLWEVQVSQIPFTTTVGQEIYGD
jgi:hypothetical protein